MAAAGRILHWRASWNFKILNYVAFPSYEKIPLEVKFKTLKSHSGANSKSLKFYDVLKFQASKNSVAMQNFKI